ncbi:MAG: hypothetical protein HC933_05925 [Pleurocapsa sp. SU_196_0]|nr:hypothetical protein [Pleurocapsa sp. SU_196_0]
MLEWFEMNRELLKSRGITIHQMLSNPEAWWVEPSVLIELETSFFIGDISTTIDGRCWYHFLPKTPFDSEVEGHFLGLDPFALEYRTRDWYGGNPNDVNWEPCFEIHQISDYDTILEPMISSLI